MADLTELQALAKKNPELYVEEVMEFYNEFQELLTTFYE
jgi:hypothetical protein